jgi:hypothetical protein
MERDNSKALKEINKSPSRLVSVLLFLQMMRMAAMLGGRSIITVNAVIARRFHSKPSLFLPLRSPIVKPSRLIFQASRKSSKVYFTHYCLPLPCPFPLCILVGFLILQGLVFLKYLLLVFLSKDWNKPVIFQVGFILVIII